MRKLAIAFIALLITLHAVIICAQAPNSENSQPRFSLTISAFYPAGAGTPGHATFRELRVDETNLSNEPLQEVECWFLRGGYSLSVTHNGSPQKERDEARRKRREANEKLKSCRGVRSSYLIPPGETRGFLIGSFSSDYPLDQPGTYKVTVSRESDPEHPEESVTVKSNTITIEVSEEEAKANTPEPELDEPITLRAVSSSVHAGDPIVVYLTQNDLTSDTVGRKMVRDRITSDVLDWASFDVRQESNQVPETKRLQQHIDSLKNLTPVHQPGMPFKFDGKILLSDYYDMSTPGEYQIAATMKCTQCGSEPVIKSNILTITVLPADGTPPTQQ